MTEFTGKVIAGCKIYEKVGEGKNSIVYHAKHQQLRQDVAFKVIKDSYLESDPKFLDRLNKKVDILKDLYHINVLHFIDSGEYNGSHYLITEYVDGPSLLRVLKLKKRLSPKIAIPLAVQALQGLEYVHEKGIFHEDLKLTNLMITRKGVLKIADFGLAEPVKFADKQKSDIELFGTPNYMAPEQWRAKKIDDKTDMYALGVVIYQLLSGIPPFWAKTTEEIKEKVLKAQFYPLRELLENFPAEMDKIIKKLLLVRPAERFQSTKILADTLRKFQIEFTTKNKIEAKTVLIKLGEAKDTEEKTIKEIVNEVLDVDEIADEDYEAQLELNLPADSFEMPEFSDEKSIIEKEEEEIEVKLNFVYEKPPKPLFLSTFADVHKSGEKILLAACIDNFHPEIDVYTESEMFAEEIVLQSADFIPEPVLELLPDEFKALIENQDSNQGIFFKFVDTPLDVPAGKHSIIFKTRFFAEDYPSAEPQKISIEIPPIFQSIKVSPEKQEPGKIVTITAKIAENEKGKYLVKASYTQDNDQNAGFGLEYSLEYNPDIDAYATDIEISENSQAQKYFLDLTANSDAENVKQASQQISFEVAAFAKPEILSTFVSNCKPGKKMLILAAIDDVTSNTVVSVQSEILPEDSTFQPVDDVQKLLKKIPEDVQNNFMYLDEGQKVFAFNSKLPEETAAGVYNVNIYASNGVDDNLVFADPKTATIAVTPFIADIMLEYADETLGITAEINAKQSQMITAKCLFDPANEKNEFFDAEYWLQYNEKSGLYNCSVPIPKQVKPDEYSAKIKAILIDDEELSDSKEIQFKVNRKSFILVRIFKALFGKKFKRVDV